MESLLRQAVQHLTGLFRRKHHRRLAVVLLMLLGASLTLVLPVLLAGRLSATEVTTSQNDMAQECSDQLLEVAQVVDPPLNLRAEAEALGNEGARYEESGQLSIAQCLTEQALGRAQAVQAWDLAYRWQWQLGRVYKEQGNREAAIANYRAAIQSVTSVRNSSNLISTSSEDLLRFQIEIEPIYRQYADLLLLPEKPDLEEARRVIASFQSVELANFLQEPCDIANLEAVDRIVDEDDRSAAFIYPILLDDRLEVIAKLPSTGRDQVEDNELIHYPPVYQPKEEITEFLQTLQKDLEREYTFLAVQRESQVVYNWLIQPIQSKLDEKGIKTLVFVLDDAFRNIPMAALYTGNQYLVEKYATSVLLGLQLIEPAPLPDRRLNVLAAGSVNPPPAQASSFPKLQNVDAELDQIDRAEVNSVILRNERFTVRRFNQQINQSDFDIVHIATHGQFDDDPGKTFLLTSDKQIDIRQFDELFQTRRQLRPDAIELLILSACETASGNALDVLGIAGAAVRAGARSAIASLWTIDDASSVAFAREFYKQLEKPDMTRSEALRLTQQSMLINYSSYEHPRYWSPYILVGSWF